MNEFPASKVTLCDPFWSPRLEINAAKTIYHQWDQLEKTGCIDNFRLLTGEKEGFREGWFFADSDAYKWLDAAARVYATSPDPKLIKLMDELIGLFARAQMGDGYIYTYNQIHFPGQRWVNMQIEHELYCLGHLIEAAVSHLEATGQTSALEIAIKAADLLVREFLGGPPERTEGHEEVEIALLRLHLATKKSKYLELAQHFIEGRGRIRFFAPLIFRENTSFENRKTYVASERRKYAAAHPEYAVSKLPLDNESKLPLFSSLRRKLNRLSGKYLQQHAPARQQTVPVGHAVRFGYFQTATTMLLRLSDDKTLLPALQQSWERMITKRMYVTGGLGSLPGNEGFGRDYELDPEYAYNETCAALASLFWNWEMVLVTREAKYSDLLEWQLYNSAAVGIGTSGDTYLYNNPLAVRGGIVRRSWYSVPCCPPNLSRTWASLGKYIYSSEGTDLWIHQYLGNRCLLELTVPTEISIESSIPYGESVTIRLDPLSASRLNLHLRIPSWAGETRLTLNGNSLHLPSVPAKFNPTAQGYDPRLSRFVEIPRIWNPGDMLTLTFGMPITLRCAHPRVKGHAGKVAVTRGPLVYCLESIENPGVDIFTVKLDPATLHSDKDETLLPGGETVLRAKSIDGQVLNFIPYHLWGNRGSSQMVVWVHAK